MDRLKWYKIVDTHRGQSDMVLPAHSVNEALRDHNNLVWGTLYPEPDTDRYTAREVIVKEKE